MAKKLIFSENLYISDSMDSQKLDKLKESLTEAPLFTKVFLIMISSNPSEQLDIIESKYLTFHYYDIHPTYVVGIAQSNAEAVSLVQNMVMDCMESRNDTDLKTYLMGAK